MARGICNHSHLGVVLGLLACPLGASADGAIFTIGGRLIPEKEQLAFIEWNAGQERLFVATRAEPSSVPNVWVVPVPASPERVRAEPVEAFPHVARVWSVVDNARVVLDGTVTVAVTLDTCTPCMFVPLGGGAAPSGFGSSGVQVHQRVEKLGMIVEVLTASSLDALDGYLAEKKLNVRAREIAALEPYLQEDYTLICGWIAQPNAALRARAIQVDFPSPAVFYPLRPTRLNPSAVETRIFVRGWVRPRAGTTLPDLQCRYVRSQVGIASVEEMFERSSHGLPYEPGHAQAALTEIQLGRSPQGWTDDLWLESGAPAAIYAAQAIWTLDVGGVWFGSSLLGMALGVFMPLVMVPRKLRQWQDWLWAIATGGCIVLSLYGTLLMLHVWCRNRGLLRRTLGIVWSYNDYAKLIWEDGLVAPALLLIPLFVLAMPACLVSCFVLVVFLPFLSVPLAICLLRLTHPSQWGMLLVFAFLHLTGTVGACWALDSWFRSYR